MKIILNTVTSYEGKSLKSGDEVDLPLNVAQRWINKGLAHVAKEEVKPIEPNILKRITDEAGRWDTEAIEDELKKLEDKSEIEVKTEESIIFREPEVIEVDVVEPIPMDHYVDFDEPKEVKPIKKVKKNK